jgi:hypothetical protein
VSLGVNLHRRGWRFAGDIEALLVDVPRTFRRCELRDSDRSPRSAAKTSPIGSAIPERSGVVNPSF